MRTSVKILSLAIGIAVCAAGPALAGPTILAETSAFFGSESGSESSGPISGPDPFYFAGAYADAEDSAGSGSGFASAESIGDVLDGVALFEVYADFDTFDTDLFDEGGSGGATATFTVSDTLTNTGAAPDTAFLDFFIDGWEMELFPGESFMSVSVSSTILVDGEAIWAFTAGITADGGVGTPFLTGFGPGGLPSQTCFDGEFCFAGSYAGLLDLGVLAPGDSVDYTYILEASVFADDILEESYGYAVISDPTGGFFGGVGPLPGSGGSGVPAPGALAVLGMGLVGLGAYRRRKSV